MTLKTSSSYTLLHGSHLFYIASVYLVWHLFDSWLQHIMYNEVVERSSRQALQERLETVRRFFTRTILYTRI